MKKLNLLSLLPVMLFPLLIAGNAHAARPYSGFLPAAVNNKSGNIFWCDAHRRQKTVYSDGSGFNGMVYCCSLETFKRLSGWNMGVDHSQ